MALPVKLQNGEEVVLQLRRHPVYAILQVLGTIVVGVLLLLLVNWLAGLLPNLSTLWTIANVIIVVGAVLIGFVAFYRYYNDLWLVTNQRLIDSTKTTPFNHTVSSTDLINVQDIGVQKKGILATMFNFGDVVCQTASTRGNFVFRGVPNPTEMLEKIDELRDAARRSSGRSPA
jgi:hypothetical protein